MTRTTEATTITPSIQQQSQQFDMDHFLQKHLKFTKKRVKYTKDELLTLITQAQFELQKDSTSILMEINYLPINIVGDIHGQWRDLLRIFNILGVPGSARYLFLGDYIDRGRRSLECISLLLALKIRFRTKVYLLRGNHECDYINFTYGFYGELTRRFNMGDALQLFKAFNKLFDYFPLAALVVGRVLCMHGGISPELKSLDQLRKVSLPTKIPHSGGLILDLLWADPKSGVRGFAENDVRDCSCVFGSDAVIKLCNKLNIDMIVRAHQALGNGFGFFARQHMVTVFSAPRYLRPDVNSFGAVLRINKNYEFSVVLLNPVTKETKGKFEEQFKKAAKLGAQSMDDITKIEKMPDLDSIDKMMSDANAGGTK